MLNFVYVIVVQRLGWDISEFFFPQHRQLHETNEKYSVETYVSSYS